LRFFNFIAKSYRRNNLENLLIEYKDLIKGKILDIGSKNRRYDYLFNGEITAIDINPKKELNILKDDLTNLNYNSNTFDSLICLEVFEYLKPENFNRGFEEICKVLKKNSNAIVTIPFYFIDHKDNIRVTFNYIRNFLENFNKFNFKIIKLGNKYTAFFDSIRLSKIEPSSLKIKYIGKNFLLLIIYLAIKFLNLENKKDNFYSGLFVILTKK